MLIVDLQELVVLPASLPSSKLCHLCPTFDFVREFHADYSLRICCDTQQLSSVRWIHVEWYLETSIVSNPVGGDVRCYERMIFGLGRQIA